MTMDPVHFEPISISAEHPYLPTRNHKVLLGLFFENKAFLLISCCCLIGHAFTWLIKRITINRHVHVYTVDAPTCNTIFKSIGLNINCIWIVDRRETTCVVDPILDISELDTSQLLIFRIDVGLLASVRTCNIYTIRIVHKTNVLTVACTGRFTYATNIIILVLSWLKNIGKTFLSISRRVYVLFNHTIIW